MCAQTQHWISFVSIPSMLAHPSSVHLIWRMFSLYSSYPSLLPLFFMPFVLDLCQSGQAVCFSGLLTAMTKLSFLLPVSSLSLPSRASYGAYWLIGCHPHRSPRSHCWLLTNGPTMPSLPPSIIFSLCSLPLVYFPTSLLSIRPA